MKKSTIVSIVFASLLISPAVLARHVQADEVATNSVEPALTTSLEPASPSEASLATDKGPAVSELSPKVEVSHQTSRLVGALKQVYLLKEMGQKKVSVFFLALLR